MAPPAKAPSVQLRITATNASINELKITHNGGDALILKDEKITVTNAVDDTAIDGALLAGVNLVDFQTGTTVNTLGAGQAFLITLQPTCKRNYFENYASGCPIRPGYHSNASNSNLNL